MQDLERNINDFDVDELLRAGLGDNDDDLGLFWWHRSDFTTWLANIILASLTRSQIGWVNSSLSWRLWLGFPAGIGGRRSDVMARILNRIGWIFSDAIRKSLGYRLIPFLTLLITIDDSILTSFMCVCVDKILATERQLRRTMYFILGSCFGLLFVFVYFAQQVIAVCLQQCQALSSSHHWQLTLSELCNVQLYSVRSIYAALHVKKWQFELFVVDIT